MSDAAFRTLLKKQIVQMSLSSSPAYTGVLNNNFLQYVVITFLKTGSKWHIK